MERPASEDEEGVKHSVLRENWGSTKSEQATGGSTESAVVVVVEKWGSPKNELATGGSESAIVVVVER